MSQNENPNGAAATTPQELHAQFQRALHTLCQDIMGKGLPMEFVMLELHIADHFVFERLKNQATLQAQAVAKSKASPIIVPPRN